MLFNRLPIMRDRSRTGCGLYREECMQEVLVVH